MENDGKDKLTAGSRRTRYCVLFTQTLKQWDVAESIKRTLPEGHGTVFYPCVELWMGSLGQTVVEPLFPGYVFVRSDMSQHELHDFIRNRRREVLAFIKELRISERKTAGEAAVDGGEDILVDLSDEEAELLDFMLGFRLEGKASDKEEPPTMGEDGIVRDVTGKGKRIWRRKLPESGVLGMSYGYKDKNDRYVVMEGPLRGHEDRIVDVNARDRRAYLNMKVGGRLARVGLTIKGKKYWFPQDKAADVLGDGTVVNCHAVAAAMMGYKRNGSR